MNELVQWLGIGGLAGLLVACGHFLPKLTAFLRSNSANFRRNAKATADGEERESDRAVAMYREHIQEMKAREAEREVYIKQLLSDRFADRERIAVLETELKHLTKRG